MSNFQYLKGCVCPSSSKHIPVNVLVVNLHFRVCYKVNKLWKLFGSNFLQLEINPKPLYSFEIAMLHSLNNHPLYSECIAEFCPISFAKIYQPDLTLVYIFQESNHG